MRRTFATLLAVLLVTTLAACGSDSDGSSAATTTTAGPTGSTPNGSVTTTTSPEALTRQIDVFFVRGDKLATGGYEAVGPTVGRQAMDALLAGPAHQNAIAGMGTQIPEGTELLDLKVVDGTATVDLSKEFVSGGGSLSMQLRVGQVVFTLTQFDTVKRVDFLIDGVEPDGLGGEGLPTSYEGRSSFEDITPLILPESPTPGQVVVAPFDITGISNTFEATLQWSVRTTEGDLLDEGFTTATAGSGTWGTFSITADTGQAAGNAVITLWEESPEDGDRVNTYEVPIVLN